MDNHLLRFRHPDLQYVVWDLETENLRLCGSNKPWQLYYMLCSGNEVTKRQNFYLKWPNLNVGKGAARVTGFDPAVVKAEGVEPKKALEDFLPHLMDKKRLVIGHNLIHFDSCVVHWAFKEVGIPSDYSWMDRLLDTNCLARGWKNGQLPKENEPMLAWQFRMHDLRTKGVKTSVGVLAKEFGIPHDPRTLHKAENDVPVCWTIYKTLLQKMEI